MIEVGDMLQATSVTVTGMIGRHCYSTTVRAKKGKGIILLALGEESLDGSGEDVDVEAVMLAMGWVPTPDRRRIIDETKAKKGATR